MSSRVTHRRSLGPRAHEASSSHQLSSSLHKDNDPSLVTPHNSNGSLRNNNNGSTAMATNSPPYHHRKRTIKNKGSMPENPFRHGSAPLRLRLGIIGTACVLWFFFDPILNAPRRQQLVALPPGWTIKKEVVYPRGLFYDLTSSSSADDTIQNENHQHYHPPQHHHPIQPIISSARHYRYAKVERLSGRNAQNRIHNSKEYKGLNEYVGLDDPTQQDCILERDWQLTYKPVCNTLHEMDLSSPISDRDGTTSRYQYLTHGYYRDVWAVLQDNDIANKNRKTVFKPMRFKHDYTYRNFDRMRRDALTMDRLTGAKYILNIYAHCGTSGLSEFADGGDIEAALWQKGNRDSSDALDITQMEKLHIATQAAMGLAAVHNIDQEGRSSIAHTDISPGQFIKVNGIYKLNDFNRARFLRYSQTNHTVCPFYVGNNAGKNRAPEEYAYGPETEMVDVYSFGNILYMLLQGDWPFEGMSGDEAAETVMKGGRPSIYEDLWNSTDPVNRVLKQAMIMCHAQDPKDRASARAVETYLKDSMKKLDPGRLEEWGDV